MLLIWVDQVTRRRMVSATSPRSFSCPFHSSKRNHLVVNASRIWKQARFAKPARAAHGAATKVVCVFCAASWSRCVLSGLVKSITPSLMQWCLLISCAAHIDAKHIQVCTQKNNSSFRTLAWRRNLNSIP